MTRYKIEQMPPLPASDSNLHGAVSDYDVTRTTGDLALRMRNSL